MSTELCDVEFSMFYILKELSRIHVMIDDLANVVNSGICKYCNSTLLKRNQESLKQEIFNLKNIPVILSNENKIIPAMHTLELDGIIE